MNKIDVAADGDDFQEIVADIKVKNCAAWGDYTPEGCRDLNDGVGALVLQTGKAGGNVHGGGDSDQGTELDLGVRR